VSDLEYLQQAIIKVLDKIHTNSLNYSADLDVTWIAEKSNISVEELIRKVYGSQVLLWRSTDSQKSVFMNNIKSGLSYIGDEGSHANREYVGSDEHTRDLKNIAVKMKPILRQCSKYVSFSFREGHPHYPVFWDFAYLLECPSGYYVFVGSACD